MQRLKDEQENFERKIQHLEQQNEVIAQEREGNSHSTKKNMTNEADLHVSLRLISLLFALFIGILAVPMIQRYYRSCDGAIKL